MSLHNINKAFADTITDPQPRLLVMGHKPIFASYFLLPSANQNRLPYIVVFVFSISILRILQNIYLYI